MPIPWFDIPKNSGGSLTAKLASDSLMVNGLTATFVSILVQNGSTLIAGVTVALVFEWRTALIAIGLLPFMLLTGVLSMKRKAGFSDQTD
jgi:ATP-binding cassette subfamily B (MDR/TAP) protein 1